MRHLVTAIIALFFIMNLIGCGGVEIPRKAFVKITADFTLKHCSEEQCIITEKASSASGSIVKHGTLLAKTYILTAGHVCDIDYAKTQLGVENMSVVYSILDSNGITFKATVHSLDAENDLCIMVTQRLGQTPIVLRSSGPSYGEKFYNIAAPAGIAAKNYVPILEGRYSGFKSYAMIFTIPAVGGSSGSPIFDNQGEMVGMIMSVNHKFPFVSYSPHYNAIEKIIEGIEK